MHTKNSIELEESIKLIKDLIEHKDKLETEMSELSNLGADLNLFNTMWEAFESYTKCVSKLVGDDHDWLSWWLYDMPEDDPRCKINGEWRVVRTVEDLVRVIDDSKVD